MITCECLTINKQYINEYAYTAQEFLKIKKPYKSIREIKTAPAGKKKSSYINDVITFDIETSTINDGEKPYAFMYIWQMCIFGDLVVMGSTFEDLQQTLNHIKGLYGVSLVRKAIIYVHNLAFEFQFIHQFVNTNYDEIFATDSHKVLYFNTLDGFEFRCSYFLTNMSLEKFIKQTPNAVHLKGVGDLDYSIVRTTETELTPIEYGYCYNDVAGLYEALAYKTGVRGTGNILGTPYTSTGYVREDVRNAMAIPEMKALLKSLKVSNHVYELLHNAYRGGNTASNRFYTTTPHEQIILKDVGSYDITSSYPYVICALAEFPMTAFKRSLTHDNKKVLQLNKDYATVGTYVFYNLKLRDDKTPIPYISESKCNNIKNKYCYNGRVMSCDYCEMDLTNIDFLIICKMYKFSFYCKELYISKKGRLPQPAIDVTLKYFDNKTLYKGGDEYLYAINKGLLNSTYGMMVTALDKQEYLLNNGEWKQSTTYTNKDGQIVSRETWLKQQIYNAYCGYNAYTAYQWGVWVSALARARLQYMIDVVGNDVVYCDTDSIKMLNPAKHKAEFEALNNKVIEDAKKNNVRISSTNPNTGETYYLGTWSDENEGRDAEYTEFITMGAKKYAFTKPASKKSKVLYNGLELGVTVAGLGKEKGARELANGNGLKDFKPGKVFYDSGRTTATWNFEPIHTIEVNGVKIVTASNVAILDTTYTLGMTDTMIDVIIDSKEGKQHG